MGWKSTRNISRSEAIELIRSRALEASNDELAEALEAIGFGDNYNLKYYGFNFRVLNNNTEEMERKEYERLKEKYGI